MEILTVDRSTLRDYQSGKITLREAREIFCKCGWFNYVPSEAQVLAIWDKIK